MDKVCVCSTQARLQTLGLCAATAAAPPVRHSPRDTGIWFGEPTKETFSAHASFDVRLSVSVASVQTLGR